jgi:hypothetical protein
VRFAGELATNSLLGGSGDQISCRSHSVQELEVGCNLEWAGSDCQFCIFCQFTTLACKSSFRNCISFDCSMCDELIPFSSPCFHRFRVVYIFLHNVGFAKTESYGLVELQINALSAPRKEGS